MNKFEIEKKIHKLIDSYSEKSKLRELINSLKDLLNQKDLDYSEISEKTFFIYNELKEYSMFFESIFSRNNNKELKFSIFLRFLAKIKQFTGSQLRKLIESQDQDIYGLFKGAPISTLYNYENEIYKQQEVPISRSLHNIPTYRVTSFDLFLGFLSILIEKYCQI